jgi:hypothetical protein
VVSKIPPFWDKVWVPSLRVNQSKKTADIGDMTNGFTEMSVSFYLPKQQLSLVYTYPQQTDAQVLPDSVGIIKIEMEEWPNLEKHYAATVARFKLPPLLQHLKMKNNIML